MARVDVLRPPNPPQARATLVQLHRTGQILGHGLRDGSRAVISRITTIAESKCFSRQSFIKLPDEAPFVEIVSYLTISDRVPEEFYPEPMPYFSYPLVAGSLDGRAHGTSANCTVEYQDERPMYKASDYF